MMLIKAFFFFSGILLGGMFLTKGFRRLKPLERGAVIVWFNRRSEQVRKSFWSLNFWPIEQVRKHYVGEDNEDFEKIEIPTGGDRSVDVLFTGVNVVYRIANVNDVEWKPTRVWVNTTTGAQVPKDELPEDADPKEWEFRREIALPLRILVYNTMSEIVGKKTLTTLKQEGHLIELMKEIKQRLQDRLNELEWGVEVIAVQVVDMRLPGFVAKGTEIRELADASAEEAITLATGAAEARVIELAAEATGDSEYAKTMRDAVGEADWRWLAELNTKEKMAEFGAYRVTTDPDRPAPDPATLGLYDKKTVDEVNAPPVSARAKEKGDENNDNSD